MLKMINNNKWENYGDVNPIPHGGFFVKADDLILFPDCYYVVTLTDMDSACGEPGFLISNAYVDLNEDWVEWEKVRDYAGLYDEDTDPGLLVEAAVSYYGPENFGGSSEVYPDEESAREELESHGIKID
jgi:hypothetical protein